jgi:hypothetical protein
MSRRIRARISPAERERRRQLYLDRIRGNTNEFLDRFEQTLNELSNEGLDIYIPKAINKINNLISKARTALDSDLESAKSISFQVGQEISQVRFLAQSAKEKIEYEEEQKRRQLIKLKDKLDSDIEKYLNDIYNGIDDPIIKDFSFDGYLSIKKDLSKVHKNLSDFASTKKEIKSQMSEVIKDATQKAGEWKKRNKEKNKEESNKELVEIYSEQIRSSQKAKSDKVNSVLKKLKSLNTQQNSEQIAEELQKSLEKTNEEVIDESIRKEAVIGIIKSLKIAGFIVEKPKITNDGYVKVLARKPSGNSALCKIDLKGKFEYKFDSYKGMSCLNDIDSFETDLEDIYGFKISEKRVLWENPDRIKKGSRDNPTGGQSRGAH